MRAKGHVLAVFAKAPVPGEVNTRLVPYISAENAARLQHELIHDRLDMACRAVGLELQLWCSPDVVHPVFAGCARRYPVTLHAQQGIDLGARMASAFERMLQDYDRAVIIGTDAPALDADDVLSAFDALQRHDYVLTPAEDGGYVLIGARRHVPGVLHGVEWGSGRVLEQTRANLDAHGCSYALMDERWDVDRPEDLERYRRMREKE